MPNREVTVPRVGRILVLDIMSHGVSLTVTGTFVFFSCSFSPAMSDTCPFFGRFLDTRVSKELYSFQLSILNVLLIRVTRCGVSGLGTIHV